ncbi:MAG: methyltransferase domain-containing protein [Betaproteobacteria bacterium]|nr:methyltransferase domain-containing protein [Betaproteobacteria bacterium]
MTRQGRIACSFGRASATYDGASELQARAARSLAARVLGYAWNQPNVLEVGCGTGGLTRLLLPHLPGNWVISDIAPAMLDAARALLPSTGAQFRIVDGEAPDLPAASLDLIVSNLAAQWFEDLPNALERLAGCLASRGRLIITTLGCVSLTEWRDAVAATGYKAGTPAYPTAQALSDTLPQAQVGSQNITMIYDNAGAFLKSLRAIGATVPAKDYNPLPVPIMRQAMTHMGAPCRVSYEILTLDWTKP